MLSSSSAQEATTSVKSDASDRPEDDTVKPKLKMGLIENVRKLWDSVRMTVFVIGTALTVFVAARNTITWYVFRIYDSAYKVLCVFVFFIIFENSKRLFLQNLKFTMSLRCDLRVKNTVSQKGALSWLCNSV